MAQWMVACKKADFKEIGKKFGIDQVTARILVNRGLTEEESIRRFLSGGLDSRVISAFAAYEYAHQGKNL